MSKRSAKIALTMIVAAMALIFLPTSVSAQEAEDIAGAPWAAASAPAWR